MGRMRSKEEQELIRQRIIVLHTKDSTLTRAVIAQRCSCSETTVVQTLRAAGLYEPRSANSKDASP